MFSPEEVLYSSVDNVYKVLDHLAEVTRDIISLKEHSDNRQIAY